MGLNYSKVAFRQRCLACPQDSSLYAGAATPAGASLRRLNTHLEKVAQGKCMGERGDILHRDINRKIAPITIKMPDFDVST